jgi:heme o synthase
MMINYYLITKPGIVLGNLITVGAGFALASQGMFHFRILIATLLGLALVMASACVFNNYIDRHVDQKMKRTQNRALVKGVISGKQALLFATMIGCAGHAILWIYTNFLTFALAGCGFFIYVVLYSLWKCRTVYGTAIGSLAGAVPPVVGYCAVSGRFDLGASLLFAIMVLWQMPHFFSIAIYRIEDYVAAAIPVLPAKKGMYHTKQRMVVYIIGFILATGLLSLFHYTGIIYLSVAAFLGILWLGLCLRGFKKANDRVWARQMFCCSLIVITLLSLILPFDIQT